MADGPPDWLRGIAGVLSGGLSEAGFAADAANRKRIQDAANAANGGGPDTSNGGGSGTPYRATSSYSGTPPPGGPATGGVQRSAPTAADPNATVPGSITYGRVGAPGMASVGVIGNNTGVEQVDTSTAGPGISGFLGGKDNYPLVTTSVQNDPNYQANRDMLAAAAAAAGSRPNVQLGPMATAGVVNAAAANQDPQAQFRAQQLQLGNALMQQANGQGPSVAGSQLQQSTEQNLQAALAQAASSRGGNLGAAQYALGNARASIQQQAAQGLAQARIQEQMAARSQLGDVLNSGRGADLSVANMGQQNNQFNASLGTNNNQFNASQANAGTLQQGQMDLQSQQQRDQMVQYYRSQGMSLDQANYQAQLQQAQYNQGSLAQQIAAASGVGIQNSAQGAQMGGAAIGALGTVLAAASDENLKTDIVDGDSHIKGFLDALQAKHYSYKDEKWGEGPRTGIMAQDAEKSALGRSFVMNTNEGKMLDVNKALSAALASVAHLNKRVSHLEK